MSNPGRSFGRSRHLMTVAVGEFVAGHQNRRGQQASSAYGRSPATSPLVPACRRQDASPLRASRPQGEPRTLFAEEIELELIGRDPRRSVIFNVMGRLADQERSSGITDFWQSEHSRADHPGRRSGDVRIVLIKARQSERRRAARVTSMAMGSLRKSRGRGFWWCDRHERPMTRASIAPGGVWSIGSNIAPRSTQRKGTHSHR
jgi:hypothetical protein